jgi:hypothetical protein
MNLKKLERYLRVNLLGPGPSSYKKLFTGPRSHKGWETLHIYFIIIIIIIMWKNSKVKWVMSEWRGISLCEFGGNKIGNLIFWLQLVFNKVRRAFLAWRKLRRTYSKPLLCGRHQYFVSPTHKQTHALTSCTSEATHYSAIVARSIAATGGYTLVTLPRNVTP